MQPKRILISLLAVILICLAAGITVSAAETSPLNLAVSVSSETAISKSPVTVQAGDTLEVSVTVAENPGVAILEFNLVYDPAVVSVKTASGKVVYENGNVFPAETNVVVHVAEPGVLNVRYIGSANATATNATLITVEFTVAKCAEATKGATAITLTVDPDYVANAEYDYVKVALANEGKASFNAHAKLTEVEKSQYPCLGNTYECPTCKEKPMGDAKEAHKPAPVPAVAPACGVEGATESEACSVCGFVTKPAEVVPALEHVLAPVAAQAVTCTTDGWDAYEECTREGCDYSTKVTIPALGHDLKQVPAKAVDCLEDGWNAYEECQRGCGYTTKEIIKATGSHTPVTDPRVEPTYSTEGKTEGSHCSVCGTVLVAQEPIPVKSLLWLWILIAVVVVAAAGVVVYFFVYKKQAQTKHIGRPGSQK